METEEVLEKAIKDVKKEKNWIVLESRFIQRLRYAAKINDSKQVRRFERKAARAEARIHQFEERVLKLISFLKEGFPNWTQTLLEIEQKIKLSNSNILGRISYIDGTIIKLLRQKWIDYNKLIGEINVVMEKGVRPLIVLLEHLEYEFKRILEEYIKIKITKKKGQEESLESYLDKRPFLILFHSANQRQYVNRILAYSYNLPEYYKGRKLEYAFEVDYFWIEHHGKISGFLGHVPNFFTPRKASKILGMRYGETSAENILKRKGLLLPNWIFSRVGRIKLAIEIKSGWGSDARALDELVKKIRMYHLEGNIIFYCFSVWALSYLKQRLPRSTTILISWKGPSGSIIHLPFNRPFETLGRWGLFTSATNLNFVDILSSPAKKSEDGIIKQIKRSTYTHKLHFAGRVKTKEQFQWLLKHGARGGMIWADINKLMTWFR